MSALQHVAITEANPGCPIITVDGLELRTVTQAVLILDGQQTPRLRLSLAILTPLSVSATARVLLDEDTTTVLTGMGWTPPPADPEGAHDDS